MLNQSCLTPKNQLEIPYFYVNMMWSWQPLIVPRWSNIINNNLDFCVSVEIKLKKPVYLTKLDSFTMFSSKFIQYCIQKIWKSPWLEKLNIKSFPKHFECVWRVLFDRISNISVWFHVGKTRNQFSIHMR